MNLSLRNQKVLITAGPTREYWDPVRFFTNASSGAMGIALANAARKRGAHVTLVLGPVPPSPISNGIRVQPVVSGWEMYEAVKKNLSRTDVFIGAAAVVDYRPARPLKSKIKRHTPTVILKLYGNPDIIAMVGHLQQGRPGTVVGFALETDHLLDNALDKLVRKRMDWIVANRESNMGQSRGSATLLSRWGDRIPLKRMTKDRLADRIWNHILKQDRIR